MRLDRNCTPDPAGAQYTLFPVYAPERAEVTSQAFTQALKDLWRRFLEAGRFRQDASDMMLREKTLLHTSAFRHVDCGTAVLEQLSCFIEHRMPGCMKVPDGSVGQLDPVIQNVFALFAEYPRNVVEHPLAIFRMEQLKDLFQIRRTAAPGIQSVDSELFVRVVGIFAEDVVVGPTTGVGQPLRFGEVAFTLSQRLPGALELSQVNHETDSSVTISESRGAGQNRHAAAVF